LWWTGAINVGICHALLKASEQDFVLVINDDLEIDDNYLEQLFELTKYMKDTLIGSVVVDIRNPGIIENGGNVVNWWTAKFRTLNSGRKLSDFPNTHCADVSLLTGRGTLIPVQVFHDVGLYDAKHFQQCGDTDLPVRARKAGYRLVVSYGAIVKSHLLASDDLNTSERYSIRDLKSYFLGVKSNFRLKYRFFFSINTARNPIQLITFLLCDLIRITWHFSLRMRLR